ncbi:hypothetical protein [Mesorhizobium sp. IMUNJ 23232]|uniref:hypothetical protein n=1 Tax=Mesorhizobium sp. IMUNJ 23232 TaxID=3376064 RepID=UPI0037A77F23
MLDALWHVRGGVLIIGDRKEERILQELSHKLAAQGKAVGQLSERSIEFNDSLWNMIFPKWPYDPLQMIKKGRGALAIFDRGKIAVSNSARGRVLSYDVRMLDAAIFCFLGAILLGGFAGVAEASISTAISISAASFAWLYGMNFLVSSFRARTFFHKIVADTP